jgi:hypothetical protein
MKDTVVAIGRRAAYKQVGGRREGEKPEWQFSVMKLLISAAVTASVTVTVYWGQWVTRMAIKGSDAMIKAEQVEKAIDTQVPVLHGRITDQERQRTEADAKIRDKIDKSNADRAIMYQEIMRELLAIRRDLGNRPTPP